ncbi:hypothetical protein HYH03_018780 [Edaphochlamys debaryana]|uniref:Cyclic nucleotide-binding domain-containing protein n=1 Tax=Edaphochlamys debaryana TaxID=47281 RepID=A0A835XFD3_9CHLO|nr:hypothetical protein HYH03_018780 [Edaphochlamys debaryana]|eukprot:KAG2482295.1 hypothetical protein HYH03_018780 [Edaphochlamys debaryana]
MATATATTLLGDTTAADVWMRGLRDADTTVWSKPVRSKRLDAAYAAVHGGGGQPFPEGETSPLRASAGFGNSSRDSSPKLKRAGSLKVQGGAAEAEVDLRAVGLCQKPTQQRTQEDIKFIQSYMCSLSYFFSLWPAPLQWELSRLLSAHILARREVALTRGRPPDRLYFVVQGRLDVRLPVPTPGGGREERTLAVLTRGHTVGESVLLGTQAQHTTVVVSSSSAILLSLSRPDFSRAFKEVLDIRQAERLMYLRLHPLLAGLPLRDLEAASDVLGLAFFPPGTRLWPLDDKDRCLYFLAEGQAKVKRPGGPAAGAAAQHEPGADNATASMYDRYTISVLGPGDIFGLPSTEQALALQLQQSMAAAAAAAAGGAGPGGATPAPTTAATTGVLPGLPGLAGSAEASLLFGQASAGALAAGSAGGVATGHGTGHGGPHGGAHHHHHHHRGEAPGAGGGAGSGPHVLIEAFSTVKVYFVRYPDYPRLPPAVQQVLQAANAFRWSYYEGRMVGLARMDNRRRDARREQLLRHANNAALRRGGDDGAVRSAAVAAALTLAERDKQLLGRVPLLSASLALGGAGAGGAGAGRHGQEGEGGSMAADARRAAAAADAALQERERLRRLEAGWEEDTGGGGGDARLPAWAMPSAAGSRMAAWARDRVAGDGAGGGPTTSPGRGRPPHAKPAAPAAAPARPTTADGGGDAASTAGGGGRAGAGSKAGGASTTRGLNPLLHRSANAKALLAVQAAQLSRVLTAERRQFAVLRQPVLHPLEGQGEYPYGYDGDESDGDDYGAGPWAASPTGTESGTESSPHYGRRRSVSPDRSPPLTAQFLTCRAEPRPPRTKQVPLQPTLSVLPPHQTTFPRVQTFRRRSSPGSHRPAGQPAGLGDCAAVETEQPRVLVVPQTVRQRHLLLFQNAQAMAAAASNSRPWIKPARQPRPSYSRVARVSQAGGRISGPGSDGGSTSSDPSQQPRGPTVAGLPLPSSRFGPASQVPLPDGPLVRGLSAGRRPVRPDDRLSRYGSSGRASSAGARASSAGGGGLTAEGSGVGVHGLLSSDLPSPKGALGVRPAPTAPPGPPQPESPELSFSHLGIREDDEDGDTGSGSLGSSASGGSGAGLGLGEEEGGPGAGPGAGEGSEPGGLAELDDSALLARVPAVLGGRGRPAGRDKDKDKDKDRGEAAGAATEGPSRAVGSVISLPPPVQQGAASPTGKQAPAGTQAARAPPPGSPEPSAAPASPAGPAEGTGAGAGVAAGPGGGLNFTMRRRTTGGAGAGPAGASGTSAPASPAAGAPPPPGTAGGAGAGGKGGAGARAGRPSAPPRGPMDAEFPQDLDERLLHMHGRGGGAAGAAAGAGPGVGPAGAASRSGVSTYAASSPSGTGVRTAGGRMDAAAGGESAFGGPGGGVPQAAQASSQPSAPPLGLPPAIALGYESLDPFAWAALAAQVGPGIRTPFSQENILPKPQWQGQA